MSPELQTILITIGALLGFIAKRVPWINNQAIPFILLAYHYIGAVLSGAGVLPGGGPSSIGYMHIGFWSSIFDPFKISFVNTAINVFLHQVQKSVRSLPWAYVKSKG